jgi:hypothetical protein
LLLKVEASQLSDESRDDEGPEEYRDDLHRFCGIRLRRDRRTPNDCDCHVQHRVEEGRKVTGLAIQDLEDRRTRKYHGEDSDAEQKELPIQR